MKLTIIVLLSIVSLVVCSDSGKGKGDNCVCREKQCTDVSCEEKNCICLVKALKALQNQKDAKYDKKYVDTYLQLVLQRCQCTDGCQKICSPDEFIKCSSSAYDRFLCKYQEFLEKIVGSKGADLFVEDINKIMADCINKDCKPTCSGNGDCDPFAISPKDCSSTKACVQKLLKSLSHLIKDDDVKEELNEFSIYVGAFYDQKLNCKHLPPKAQAICELSANNEIENALDNLFKNLVNISGPCTAISILSAIKQGVLECALKK